MSLKSYIFIGYQQIAFQRAEKVMSDSPGLVDFAIGLVFFVKLAWQASAVFRGNSNYRRIVINPANQKGFWG